VAGALLRPWPTVAISAALILSTWLTGNLQAAAPSPTNPSVVQPIGMEGSVAVMLPRADYRLRPLDDRTELLLRIDRVEPATNGQHRYQLHYIGFEPGVYSLADFMVNPDGSRPVELATIRVPVHARLPDDHNGQLNLHVPDRFPFIGGYRAMLGTLGVIWIGGFVAYAMANRKKRPPAFEIYEIPTLSLAERLRPLVEAAARGELNVAGQANLERLLIGYWREKLNLPDQRMADALRQLKAHGEAGDLLRALERWLHRPGGVSTEEVSALLRPYHNIPVAGATREGVPA
jgi:hypothetical protein